MKRTLFHIFPVFLILAVSSSICHADFQSRVRESVSDIEAGDYNKAASAIDQIGNDPLSHKILGIIYLHTGKLDLSESEFRKTLATNPNDWQSEYALGLISAVEKKPSDAEKHLTSAEKIPEAKPEVGALRQYLSFLNGKALGIKPSDVPLSSETRALSLIKSGKKDEARDILLEIVSVPGRLGFEEAVGPVATYDSTNPVRLPTGKLTWKPTKQKEYPSVSGKVTLKAEVGQTDGVYFASYYVDNNFEGITNCKPYQFEWITNDTSNGLHEIRVEAKDRFGNLISRKTVMVRVSNISTNLAAEGLPEDLSERIWNCIRVNDSRKVAHYELGKVYLDLGDKANAIAQLEYSSAYQPDYRDTRQTLNRLRGREARYIEIQSVPSAKKKIALTFDDGPNERTAEMLDMLAKLNVKATFFLVGFRAEAQPDLVKAIVSAGHDIENHTYSHTFLTQLNANQVELELCKTAAVIRSITGRDTHYFRPTGGHTNEATRVGAARQGYTEVYWTINCSPVETKDERFYASLVISHASDGGIVLMHNGDPVADSALPKIVEQLRKQGYEFVTIPELVSSKKMGANRSNIPSTTAK